MRLREFRGPPDVATWEKSWRVFRTGAIIANLATAAVLDVYAARFRQRVERYPGAWSICARADQRCRSEWWEHERRRQMDFHARAPELSGYNPDMPWNAVIKEAAVTFEFWHEELERPALMASVGGRGSSGATVAGPPRNPDRSRSPGARRGRRRGARAGPAEPSRKSAAERPGRAGGGGKQVCFAYNRSPDGCAAVCPNDRSHVCEACAGAHRAVHCPKYPGWKAPAGKGAGKKGKHS